MSSATSRTSFLRVFGQAESSRVMAEAIANAARENREAGLTTVSFIDGQLVVTPGKERRGTGDQIEGPHEHD